MLRECSKCHQPFAAKDLAKEESKGMEGERKAQGMHGVRFLYYTCSHCCQADIFVDILQMDRESAEDFKIRKDTLQDHLKQLHGDHAEVVFKTRATGQRSDL
jgi:hypothetical protein